MSVLNAQNAVGELRNFLIVCNHDYGLEKFFTGNFEQSQHILACSRIKISGWSCVYSKTLFFVQLFFPAALIGGA